MNAPSPLFLMLVSLGCSSEKTDVGSSPGIPSTCDATLDTDADGLDDCTELELGLDPEEADTDGDGIVDAIEIDCGSDPIDIDDFCYECGWGRNDPGDISATGAGHGDVMENIALVDQCREEVDIYDFAGEYHILYMTAAF
jgi:hypothetical protein